MFGRLASRMRPASVSKNVNRIQRRKLGTNWYVEVPEAEKWAHVGRANPATQSQPMMQLKGVRMAAKFMSPAVVGGMILWYWEHNNEPIWLDNSLYQWVEKEE